MANISGNDTTDPITLIKNDYPCRDQVIDGLFERLRLLKWPFMVINGSHCTGKSVITKSLLNTLHLPFSWTNCLEIVSLKNLQQKILYDIVSLTEESLDSDVVFNHCSSNEVFIAEMKKSLISVTEKTCAFEKETINVRKSVTEKNIPSSSNQPTRQSRRKRTPRHDIDEDTIAGTKSTKSVLTSTKNKKVKEYKCLIVLDNYEKLVSENINILPILNEIHNSVKESITLITLLITTLSCDKLMLNLTAIPQPLIFTFPNFSKDDLPFLVSRLREMNLTREDSEIAYNAYCEVVTGTLSSAIDDITKLSTISETSFTDYFKTLESDKTSQYTIKMQELSTKLRKNFTEKVDDYVWKMVSNGRPEIQPAPSSSVLNKLTTVKYINDLPLTAKYLLIAAFIASYSSKTCDKKFFVVHSDKRRVTRFQKRKDSVISGPKLFTLERFLHIYESLIYINESANPSFEDALLSQPTNQLMFQIETLVLLKLLIKVSSATITPLSSLTKYQISDFVTFEYIENLAKSVNFQIKEILN